MILPFIITFLHIQFEFGLWKTLSKYNGCRFYILGIVQQEISQNWTLNCQKVVVESVVKFL